MLAGNDIVGDILANYLGATNTPVDRIYEGSYNALVDLYRGTAHAALTHLYDGETDSYNVAAVKRLLPGVPVKVVRLVNRECGCGSRILLDERLACRGVSGTSIEGYGREANSALSMASFVARGAADAGIGAERVFRQVEGVDFLPLQDVWLDIALVKRPGCERAADAIAKLARTRPFREEIGSIIGYDASRMGEVVFER